MSLAPGFRLGAYEILAPLGAGGMGELYKARDTRLDRTVAIKTLLPDLSALPEFCERFEREARAVAALSHPHICALYDIGQQDRLDYLVMEFVEGETLAERLKAGVPPLDKSLRYLRETADAVQTAHRQGVVHRDIKPSNILLDRDDHVKLADFGIAKQVSAEVGPGTRITAEGTVVGTPSYMSPEQVRGAPIGPASDVFSFGCVMYELVAGLPPFERSTDVETLHAVLTSPAPPLASLGLPSQLVTLIERVLDKDPDKRPPARTVCEELTAVATAWRASLDFHGQPFA